MLLRVRRWIGAAETVAALLAGWVLVFVIPFRRSAMWLGGTGTPVDGEAVPAGQIRRAKWVAWRLARLARRMPWRTTCLVQAVAGKLLLARRGIASTIRFGVTTNGGALAAHAWLIVGNDTVLGGDVAADFQPLADLGRSTQ